MRTMNVWLREQEQRRLAESREFARGFWHGTLWMGVVCIGIVILALAAR